MWPEYKKGEEKQSALALSVEAVAKAVGGAQGEAAKAEKMVEKVMRMWAVEEEPKGAGVLVFGKEAWLKVMVWATAADGEVTMMGVTRDKDALYVEDVVLLDQEVTTVSVDMYGGALAAHMEECAAKGIEPRGCMRVWIHTHPRGVTAPSGTDWATFRETFGGGDHAVMFIMCAESGWMCAKLAVVWEGVRFETDLKVWTPTLGEADRAVVKGLVEEFRGKVRAPAASVHVQEKWFGEGEYDWGQQWADVCGVEEPGRVMGAVLGGQVLVLKKGGVWGMVDVKDLWDGALGRIGGSVYRYGKKGGLWTYVEAMPGGGATVGGGPVGTAAREERKMEDVMEKVLRAGALSGEEVMWVLDRLVDEAEDVCEVMRAGVASAEELQDAEEVADSFREVREKVEVLDGWPDRWVEPADDRMWE